MLPLGRMVMEQIVRDYVLAVEERDRLVALWESDEVACLVDGDEELAAQITAANEAVGVAWSALRASVGG